MFANDKQCTLALTPGDPAGIGPDLTVLLSIRSTTDRIVVIADRNMLEERSKKLQCETSFCSYDSESQPADKMEVLHFDCDSPVVPGKGDPSNARYVLNTLDRAVQGCLSREFDAMVTGPVNKEIIARSGIPFVGHTEYLAELTGSKCPVMLLTDGELRVALVTTHIPLNQVAEAITREKVTAVATVLHNDLRIRLDIASPRIGVCGLNPHAGEGGVLGDEEIEKIIPAIEMLQKEGINAVGPLPADTIFVQNQLEKFDVILAMYHDQGLPVVKYAGFGDVVNVTLGLPIVRTSVDHGTAYGIAGTGSAEINSLLSAVEMARELSRV